MCNVIKSIFFSIYLRWMVLHHSQFRWFSSESVAASLNVSSPILWLIWSSTLSIAKYVQADDILSTFRFTAVNLIQSKWVTFPLQIEMLSIVVVSNIFHLNLLAIIFQFLSMNWIKWILCVLQFQKYFALKNAIGSLQELQVS